MEFLLEKMAPKMLKGDFNYQQQAATYNEWAVAELL
jgi:hypothetical protein